MSSYHLWVPRRPTSWAGLKPPVFALPTVSCIPPDNNRQVYAASERSLKR